MPDYTAMKQQHRLQELEADNKHFEVQNKVLQSRLEAAFKERDEALFDLAFRRDLYTLQENQLDEMRKQLAEAVSSCNIWQAGHSKLVADRDEWKLLAVEQERDLKEASKALERAKSNKRVMKEQHKELNEELAVVRKQNAEQLTILQENGIAEYGN